MKLTQMSNFKPLTLVFLGCCVVGIATRYFFVFEQSKLPNMVQTQQKEHKQQVLLDRAQYLAGGLNRKNFGTRPLITQVFFLHQYASEQWGCGELERSQLCIDNAKVALDKIQEKIDDPDWTVREQELLQSSHFRRDIEVLKQNVEASQKKLDDDGNGSH